MRVGFKTDFSELDKAYKEAEEQLYQEAIAGLARIGEMYVSESRNSRTYKDRTGNLNNANSYRVYRDGVEVVGSTGRPETGSMFNQLKTGKGLELIVGNGMEYASFVEGKGFNVTTSGFMLVEREVREMFSKD